MMFFEDTFPRVLTERKTAPFTNKAEYHYTKSLAESQVDVMINNSARYQRARANRLKRTSKAPRRLSRVLMRITLLVTLVLGISAGLFQLAIDLHQEKEAVALNAGQFLDSVSDSTATAVYNYFDEGAEQVAEGLFTQPAIQSVTILAIGDDTPMVARSRDVVRTLPDIGPFTQVDKVTLHRDLHTPPGAGPDEIIGSVNIVVDRSVVPPAIVNRMIAIFLSGLRKEFCARRTACRFCLCCVGAARHLVG